MLAQQQPIILPPLENITTVVPLDHKDVGITVFDEKGQRTYTTTMGILRMNVLPLYLASKVSFLVKNDIFGFTHMLGCLGYNVAAMTLPFRNPNQVLALQGMEPFCIQLYESAACESGFVPRNTVLIEFEQWKIID